MSITRDLQIARELRTAVPSSTQELVAAGERTQTCVLALASAAQNMAVELTDMARVLLVARLTTLCMRHPQELGQDAEFVLWRAVGAASKGPLGLEVDDLDISRLSQIADGWVVWNEAEELFEFCELPRWLGLFQNWQHEQEQEGSNGEA
jgi:hypothetical protein